MFFLATETEACCTGGHEGGQEGEVCMYLTTQAFTQA